MGEEQEAKKILGKYFKGDEYRMDKATREICQLFQPSSVIGEIRKRPDLTFPPEYYEPEKPPEDLLLLTKKLDQINKANPLAQWLYKHDKEILGEVRYCHWKKLPESTQKKYVEMALEFLAKALKYKEAEKVGAAAPTLETPEDYDKAVKGERERIIDWLRSLDFYKDWDGESARNLRDKIIKKLTEEIK